jgi:hypothetical protein
MVLEYPDDDSFETKHVALKHNWYYMLCVEWNLKLNKVSNKTQRDDDVQWQNTGPKYSHYDEYSEIQNKTKKVVLMLQGLFTVIESDHFISDHREVEVTSC